MEYNVAICGFSATGRMIGNYNWTTHKTFAEGMIEQARQVAGLIQDGYELTNYLTDKDGELENFDTAYKLTRLGEIRYVVFWGE